MEELANIGKMISVFILICIYACGWAATVSFLKKKNDEIGVRLFSIIWLVIHGLAFAVFLIWSWIGV